MNPSAAELLDGVVLRLHRTDQIGHDPLQFPRRFTDPRDQEVVALLAALLAWGRVAQIESVLDRLLARLGERPAETLTGSSHREIRRLTDGIIHRVITSEDLANALVRIGSALTRNGSLRALFLREHSATDETIIPTLARFVDTLCGRDNDDSRGLKHMFARPARGSACKRWMLFLRWVVRPADGVDLGLWPEVSPAQLVIPLDTHIHRVSRNLLLTKRADASMRTALEITSALRAWRPDDPVACDFALSRLGIHQECPTRVNPAICEGCGLRSACRHGIDA